MAPDNLRHWQKDHFMQHPTLVLNLCDSFSLWPLWILKTDGSVAAETPVLKSFECKPAVVTNEWSEASFQMALKYACLCSDDHSYYQNHDCHTILKPFLIWHLWFVGCCGIQFQFHNKMKSSTITYKRSAESCYTRPVQRSQQSRNWRNSTGSVHCWSAWSRFVLVGPALATPGWRDRKTHQQ